VRFRVLHEIFEAQAEARSDFVAVVFGRKRRRTRPSNDTPTVSRAPDLVVPLSARFDFDTVAEIGDHVKAGIDPIIEVMEKIELR